MVRSRSRLLMLRRALLHSSLHTLHRFQVPYELLVEIFTFLTRFERAQISRTCKLFRIVAGDMRFWRCLNLRAYRQRLDNETLRVILERHGDKLRFVSELGVVDISEHGPFTRDLRLPICNHLTNEALGDVAELCEQLQALVIIRCALSFFPSLSENRTACFLCE